MDNQHKSEKMPFFKHLSQGIYLFVTTSMNSGYILYAPDSGRIWSVSADINYSDAVMQIHKAQPTQAQTYTGAKSIRTLFVMPTFLCNLKCSYCHVSTNDHGRMTIAEKDIAAGLEYVCDNTNNSRISIVLSGGEPLLAIDRVLFTLETAKKLVKKKRINGASSLLFSNGTLVSRKIAESLASYQCSTALSIDGPEEIHDKARRFRDGHPSYSSVVKAAEHLRAAGVPVIASMTLGPHNWQSFPDCVEHVIRDLGIGNVLVSVFHDRPGQLSLDPEVIACQCLKAHDRALMSGGSIDTVFRRIVPLACGLQATCSCDSHRNRITLLPNGQVSLCTGLGARSDHFYGAVADRSFERHKTFNAIRNQHILDKQACVKCPGRQVCGGGCTFNSILQSGTYLKEDEYYCAITCTVLEQAFEALAGKILGANPGMIKEISIQEIHLALLPTDPVNTVEFLKTSDVFVPVCGDS